MVQTSPPVSELMSVFIRIKNSISIWQTISIIIGKWAFSPFPFKRTVQMYQTSSESSPIISAISNVWDVTPRLRSKLPTLSFTLSVFSKSTLYMQGHLKLPHKPRMNPCAVLHFHRPYPIPSHQHLLVG